MGLSVGVGTRVEYCVPGIGVPGIGVPGIGVPGIGVLCPRNWSTPELEYCVPGIAEGFKVVGGEKWCRKRVRRPSAVANAYCKERKLCNQASVGYRQLAESDDSTSVAFVALLTIMSAITIAALLLWVIPAASLNGVGFFIGTFGVVVTLGGFGITIWQVSETRSASQEATRAVGNLRSDVKSLDVISEIHVVTSALSQALQALKSNDWEAASVIYEKIRNGLNKIVAISSNSGIGLDETRAKDFISHLIAAATELDTVVQDAQIDTSDMRTQLRLITDFAVSLETQVRDKIGDH